MVSQPSSGNRDLLGNHADGQPLPQTFLSMLQILLQIKICPTVGDRGCHLLPYPDPGFPLLACPTDYVVPLSRILSKHKQPQLQKLLRLVSSKQDRHPGSLVHCQCAFPPGLSCEKDLIFNVHGFPSRTIRGGSFQRPESVYISVVLLSVGGRDDSLKVGLQTLGKRRS
jgi:hypothetical protein